jgi:hypothetical protein
LAGALSTSSEGKEAAYSMIGKKPAPDLIRGGCRFPVCAKPRQPLSRRDEASAGEGRSEKIMLKQKAKAKLSFQLQLVSL